MADINATDLTQETLSSMDGNEQIIMFDTAEGKRATVQAVGEYVLSKLTSTLMGSSQTVQSAFNALNNRIIWSTRNDTKITTSLTDIVDSLGLGFHIRWSTANDATVVGAPTNHGYHYIINKMESATAIVYAYRMGTSTFENYQKQKYGVDGWGAWIAASPSMDNVWTKASSGYTSGIDPDTYTTPGFYHVGISADKSPVSGSAIYGMLVVFTGNDGQCQQLMVAAHNGNMYIRGRNKTSAGWGTWNQLALQSSINDLNNRNFTDLSSQGGSVNLIPLVTSLYKGSYVYRIDNATEAPVTGGCLYKITKTHTVNDTRCIITAIPMSTDSPDVYTAFVPQNATAIVWQRKMSYYAPTRIANNTDLNTLTTPGSYYADTPTGVTNTPSDLSSGVYRLDTISLANTTRADGTYVRIYQTLTDFYGNVWRRGARTRATANVFEFDDWKKVTTSEDLTPTTLTLTYTSNSYVSDTDFNRLRVFKIGSLYVCNGNFSITNDMPTATSNVEIGTISGWSSTHPINIDVPMQNGSGVVFISISTTGTVTLTNLSGVTIKGWCKFNASTI